MNKVEAVRLVLADCGEVPAHELAALVESRFGVKIRHSSTLSPLPASHLPCRSALDLCPVDGWRATR
jgi:hypothetical protein